MILKESLFNPGIYKNTLKRFKWGSFIYFIMLFLSVPFAIMMRSPESIENSYYYGSRISQGLNYSVIFDSGYVIFPMIAAIAVPMVCGLLVFNYVHAQRNGVFTHSLPVSRTSNYISSIFASFTLMYVPVILNTLILMILSVCGYGKVLTIGAALSWMFLNMFVLFVMFSITTFAAFLTGNSFALVAINAMINVLSLVIYAAIIILGDRFLYGFALEGETFIRLIDFSPVVWIFKTVIDSANASAMYSILGTWLYVIAGAVFFVLGYLLYRKRKIECCTEVAAFHVLKPVLKYTATAFAAVLVMLIMYSIEINAVFKYIVAAVICAIVYFGSEMLLQKNLRVFSAYKGYIVFALCCAAVICFTAFTSVFGFETYVPKAEEVQSVSFEDSWNFNGTEGISDEKAIKNVIDIHESLLSDIPVTKEDEFDAGMRDIQISYELKNGKTVQREYSIAEDAYKAAMNKMFESEEYKINYFGINRLNIENVKYIEIGTTTRGVGYNFTLTNEAEEFLRAVEQDLKTITFDEYSEESFIRFNCSIYSNPEEDAQNNVFKPVDGNYQSFYRIEFDINDNFKNAVEVLKKSGWYDETLDYIANRLCITKYPYSYYDIYPSKEGDEAAAAVDIDSSFLGAEDVVKISYQDARRLIEDENITAKSMGEFDKNQKTYLILPGYDKENEELYLSDYCIRIIQSDMPEYLTKYVK